MSFDIFLSSFVFAILEGCGYISSWRGIPNGVHDEMFGKQGHCGEYPFMDLTDDSIFVDLISLHFALIAFIFFQLRPRYSFKKKEGRPGEFQVGDAFSVNFSLFLWLIFINTRHYLLGVCFLLRIIPSSNPNVTTKSWVIQFVYLLDVSF